MLWRDIYVAPIVEDSLKRFVTFAGILNHTFRKVEFPKGNDWVWVFNNSAVFKGGSTLTRDFQLDEFPVYHRKGSIIPMHVTSDTSLFGDSSSKDHLTAVIYPIMGESEHTVVRYA